VEGIKEEQLKDEMVTCNKNKTKMIDEEEEEE
jgi:hypothetical protein